MITLIGDGGHAAVIRDLIRARERLDKTFEADGTIIAVGSNRDRKREAEERKGERFTYLVHPSATIASSALIGMGTVIMAGAIVQARAVIGEHCILNTGCTVDHDCIVHDFAHISPNATLCGAVEVGEGAWVGAGAVVIQGMKVKPWSILSAGSTLR
ncbi:MAG: acetyltransferase [Sulfuricaulis sp.]|nr:acetyltransferase [Sulfuricaulis sp.]